MPTTADLELALPHLPDPREFMAKPCPLMAMTILMLGSELVYSLTTTTVLALAPGSILPVFPLVATTRIP